MKIAVFAALLLLVVVGLVFFFAPNEKSGPWKETTAAYSLSCADDQDCKPVAVVRPGHGGPAVMLSYNSAVDDPVAQWGDCVQSVMACRKDGKTWRDCVGDSLCPASCIGEFSNKISDSVADDAQENIFESIFIDEGGSCVPQ